MRMPMGTKILDVKDGNFEEEVLHSEVPVLLDFSAEWCGPCKQMAPIMEEIATEFEGRAKVGNVDVGADQETAVRLGVLSVPTVIFFKGGKVQEKLVGPAQKSALVSRLERLL
jgi:thioredoxin